MNKALRNGAMLLTLCTPLALVGCDPSSQGTMSQAVASQSANDQQGLGQVHNVYLVVEPGMKFGPDGKRHDAFINGDFTVQVGKPVQLHILNYDEGAHSLTAPDLNLNVQIQGTTKKGEPKETVANFTPTKEGTFNWNCVVPCDGTNGSYSMGQDGFMMGYITVQ